MALQDQSNRAVLSLRDYAVALAHLGQYREAGESNVLRQLGVDAHLWEATSAHWRKRIVEEFDDDAAPVARQFAKSLADAKTEILADPRPLAEVKPLLEAPKVGAEFSPVDATALGMRVVSAALPFSGTSFSPPANADATVLGGLDVDGTADLVPVDVRDGTLPFNATSAPVRLSLAQYASLNAELQRGATSEQEVLARYGLSSEAARTELDAHWRRHFATHPDDEKRLTELIATYTDWLTRGKDTR